MNNPTLDTRRITIFLALAFGIAWAFGLVVYLTGGMVNSPEILPGTGITLAIAVIALGYMWAPAIAHILTRVITREGRKNNWLGLNIGPRMWSWAAAWFLPAILTILGLVVYFAIFPGQFDPQLGTVQQMIQSAESRTGQAIPLSSWLLVLIQVGEGLLLAPLLNSFFTFGEEFGWRAYLQPKLMPLGYRRALLATGVIWGVWHWPIIAMGHNYGLNYFGYPWTGFIAMTWFTMSAGVIFGWLALRGGSVWPAVIAHAATNGIAGLGVLFLLPGATPSPLLGPLPVAFIGGIPWLLFAAYLLWKGESLAS